MANTTFSGTVRSENGFEDITKTQQLVLSHLMHLMEKLLEVVFNLYLELVQDLDNLITELTTTGANALTLADGTTSGQIKIVNMIVDGDGTLTPTTFANGTTITFDAVGESATLVWKEQHYWLGCNFNSWRNT